MSGIPAGHHWDDLRKAAKQPDVGKRVDEAMEAIERENPTQGSPAQELHPA